jgi:DNA-directed RNA polymerase omega subunit
MVQNPDSEPRDDEADGPPAPITSRFLFVDVAAQRAKQLRRGALPRLERHSSHNPHKLERIAMEEVRSGMIDYALPTRVELYGKTPLT